jgi:peptide/nickel transport system permease protein
MRTAPLTASFGMLRDLDLCHRRRLRADDRTVRRGRGGRQAFAPPDETMILGGDQLGRDMFSRLVYGARNTVGLALIGHGSRLRLMGTIRGASGGDQGRLGRPVHGPVRRHAHVDPVS